MALMKPATRDQLPPDLHPLWDECERTYAAFRGLWSTMANSPAIFRHIWGELLELKRTSPVAARHFETGIVVVSTLTRCQYWIAHHSPLAEAAGLGAAQVAALGKLAIGALDESYEFPVRPGFSPDDSLVVDLAYFLVWSGVYPHVRDTHPRVVRTLRHRLYARLAERFTPRQIEEMTWRFTQCLAFNLHNDFLEIDDDAR